MAESYTSRQIRAQVKLSFARSFEFCVGSIRHRFFRSMATLAVITLAIAFLMNVLTESMLTRAVARGVSAEFAALYVGDQFQRRASKDLPLGSLAEELSQLKPGQPRWRELERFMRDPAAFAELTAAARQEALYNAFFDNIDYARKRKLVRGLQGAALFEFLSDDAHLTDFMLKLKAPEMATLKLPDDRVAFAAFMRAWPRYRANLEKLKAGGIAAVVQAESEMKMPLDQALLEASEPRALASGPLPDGRGTESWLLTALRNAGFETSETEISAICAQRHAAGVESKFRAYAADSDFRNQWGSLKTDEDFTVETLLRYYAKYAYVRAWVAQVADGINQRKTGPLPCAKDEALAFAREYRKQADALARKTLTPDADYEANLERQAPSLLDPASLGTQHSALSTFVSYLGDNEFRMSWDQLGTAVDYSPAAVLLQLSNDETSLRAQAWLDSCARRIATRVTGPLPAAEAELLAVAHLQEDRIRIRGLNAEILRRGGGAEGLGGRAFWLIAVSLVVCVVGIANAMLTAVTERFREIATMKCLGSLDSFIMTIFMIESGLQGLLGAILGMILGLALALLRCSASFGGYTLWCFPLNDVLWNTLISIVAGMLLAMLAAVYPAWMASRMAPMEAMRVE